MQIGHLKKGLNPPSVSELGFGSPYLMTAIKAGATIGIISLAVSSNPSRHHTIASILMPMSAENLATQFVGGDQPIYIGHCM